MTMFKSIISVVQFKSNDFCYNIVIEIIICVYIYMEKWTENRSNFYQSTSFTIQ